MPIFILIEKITLFLFFVYLFQSVIFHVYLWQIKEYRLDRIISHLKTTQGKKLLFHPLSWLKLLVIFVLLYFAFLNQNPLVLLGVFLVYSLSLSRLIYKKNIFLKLLILNIRSLTIIIYSLMVNILLLINLDFFLDFVSTILLVDRLVFLSVAIGVFFTFLPSLFKRIYLAKLAQKKILSNKDLITVGITGSFGKTSTKEFLAFMLSEKYKVSKTEDYHNTEVGVAYDILNRLSKDTEIFIAEMGAYKKGEIKAICKIVNPQIGVITGINQQHLDLFGSMEKIIETKFELINSLKKNGIAVFNADNSYVQKMIEWTKRQRPDLIILTYQKQVKKDNTLSATNINFDRVSLSFDLIFKRKKVSCKADVLGMHNIYNLLAASAVCLSLRMSLVEVKESMRRIKVPPHTMKLKKGYRQSTYVDDSFNSNYDGVLSAIEYMKIFTGKKILILTPLIELGKEAKKIHQHIGENAAKVCHFIFLTNLNYYQSFIKGASRVKKGRQKVYIILETKEAVKIIKKNIDKDSVVLFSGKEASKLLEQLTFDN